MPSFNTVVFHIKWLHTGIGIIFCLQALSLRSTEIPNPIKALSIFFDRDFAKEFWIKIKIYISQMSTVDLKEKTKS